MFDQSFEVGGVVVLFCVFGLVQLVKLRFGLDGWRVVFLTFALAFVMYAAGRLLPFLPDPWGLIGEIVYGALAYALSAAGLYNIGKAVVARDVGVLRVDGNG